MNRSRLTRTLTFWLRPAFALRVLNRFQRMVGFDRAMALASSALTALVPLAIFLGAFLVRIGRKDVAHRVIDRYGLTGGGAQAVEALFTPAGGTGTSLGLLGLLFLVVSVLSFTRAAQRVFEQAWELKPLGVRNSLNGLKWILGLLVCSTVGGWIHVLLSPSPLGVTAAVCSIPLTAVFLVWGGWILTARRVPWRALLPFGAIGSAALAAYSVGSAVYLPHHFNVYATRYGAMGAVFAMVTALFVGMVVVVASAAAGREVHDELGRIARGERPADDEVRRQWDEVLAQARDRWQTVRMRAGHLRRRQPPADG